MKTFKFKTNLKCNNCVSKVKDQLDRTTDIQSWSVDLKNPDRILTVETDNDDTVFLIEKILKEAGYRAEACPD